jgi:hypothetical protein
MKRRVFLQVVCAIGTLFAVPFLRRVKQCVRAGGLEALRGRTYPGRVIPLDGQDVWLPGKWAG